MWENALISHQYPYSSIRDTKILTVRVANTAPRCPLATLSASPVTATWIGRYFPAILKPDIIHLCTISIFRCDAKER
jgi:hypothetical protein